MTKRRIALIHASRASVDPVTQYYSERAPEFELTNLLDDGVMRLLLERNWDRAMRLLAGMTQLAHAEYGAEYAVLTCSAVPPEELERLRQTSPIPLLKIDEPMAEAAVGMGGRVGVLSTFPSTQQTTRDLILGMAAKAGRKIELVEELAWDALQALLRGDAAEHDRLLLAACEKLRGRVDVLVLAQVSMARLAPEAAKLLGVPVINSLDTSLDVVRHAACAEPG